MSAPTTCWASRELFTDVDRIGSNGDELDLPPPLVRLIGRSAFDHDVAGSRQAARSIRRDCPREGYTVLLHRCRVDPIPAHLVAILSVIMHETLKSAVMIEVVHQESVPSYGPLRFDPRLRHRQRSIGQRSQRDNFLRHVEGSHGSHERQGQDRHRDQDLGKAGSGAISHDRSCRHERDTRPVMLTVKVSFLPIRSNMAMVVAVADRPLG